MTLTSVSIALPNINFHSIKELIGCVNEGLMYIKVAEDNLDARKDLANIRRAGSRISVVRCWSMLQVAGCGSPEDSHWRTKFQRHAWRSLWESKAEIHRIQKERFDCLSKGITKWPTNMLAANCMYGMYGICQTLLVSSDIIEFENSKIMFDKLSIMITDHGHNRRLSYKPTKSYAMPPWHH